MIDFRKIGGRMPRRRDERGWVKKVGKTQRMWEGYFHVYVRLAEGTEKRRRRSRLATYMAKAPATTASAI